MRGITYSVRCERMIAIPGSMILVSFKPECGDDIEKLCEHIMTVKNCLKPFLGD